MFDRPELQRIWNRTHQEKAASEDPEEDVVAFAYRLQRRFSSRIALLDVGCGRGRNAFYLSQLGFNVYGCDLSPVALAIAQTRTRQANITANFQAADLIHLPYSDNLFTAVICVHVLPYHYKVDILSGVRELWRVLQPNGWLYFDLLDCGDAEYGCGRELEKHTFFDPDGMPVHFSSRQEVNELLCGFTPERVARLELKSSSGAQVRVGWAIWATKSSRSH